jgi:hypothetical protein
MVLNQIILIKNKMLKNVMGHVSPYFTGIFQEDQKLNTQVNCWLFNNTGSVVDCILNFEIEQVGSVMRARSGG